MNEGIDYREDGSIAINTDTEHVLRIPTADEVLSWEEQIWDAFDKARDRLADYRSRIDALDEDDPERDKLERELQRFSRRPNYDFTLSWLTDVLETLGDGFPPRSEWPSWLLDQKLPGAFVTHWKHVPLVSGSKTRPLQTPNDNG